MVGIYFDGIGVPYLVYFPMIFTSFVVLTSASTTTNHGRYAKPLVHVQAQMLLIANHGTTIALVYDTQISLYYHPQASVLLLHEVLDVLVAGA